MTSRLAEFAAEIVKNAAIAALEPTKDRFRTRSGQLGAITKVLRSLGHDELREFASPKGRDDFLWATANYLAPLGHEELIVAIGSRRGQARSAGASLRRVHRTLGQRDRVTLTPKLVDLLEQNLEREGAEVVLVHNHPPNLWKTAIRATIGWRPVASTPDRALATRLLQTRLAHLLTSSRPSSLKWYLFDDGELGEFLLPPADVLLGWLQDSAR